MKNKMSRYKYYPKRPVRSFQDLTVYQKTYNLAIEIVRRVSADIARSSAKTKDQSHETAAEIIKDLKCSITEGLTTCILRIPLQIAKAHSLRFGDGEQAIDLLEKAMLNCNLAVVYLEQFRDLINKKIEAEYFEEQIKEYLRVRGKIMRLQLSWKKWYKEKKD